MRNEPYSRRAIPLFVRPREAAALAGLAILFSCPARAEPPQLPLTAPAQDHIGELVPGLGEARKALHDHGLDFEMDYLGETFVNPTGGVRQGFTYDGLLETAIDADLGKIASLTGAKFHVSAYQIHGRSFSSHNILSYSSVNWPDARPATRLGELWLEQTMGPGSLRLGQITPYGEFLYSQFAALNADGTFGWPNLAFYDLPGGGPVYPLASLGARLKLSLSSDVTLLAAIYNGDPAGAGFSGDQEIKNPAGVNFRFKDPPLLMSEAQFSYSIGETGLPGTVKFGGWMHFGRFPDQRFDSEGRYLADPQSNEKPLLRRGDFAVYAMADQWLWRAAEDTKKGIGAFGRLMAAPSDRNPLSFYADAGVDFKGVWSARPKDEFGFAAAYTRISPALSASDRDKLLFQEEFTGKPVVAPSWEIAFEANYRFVVTSGWIVQPDFQYIFRPGGGKPNPKDSNGMPIRDAAIFGLRTLIEF
jgi:porin